MSLFNLLAEIITKLENYPEHNDALDLTKEYEQILYDKVEKELEKWEEELVNAAVTGISETAYHDILTWAAEHDNYYIYRALLLRIDIHREVNWHDVLRSQNTSGFEALNDNVDSTGILVIPKVNVPKTTYVVPEKQGDEADILERRTADVWGDYMNARLVNFYYVRRSDLRGYTVRNYICDLTYGDSRVEELSIGVAPMWNLPMKELLSFDDTVVETDIKGNQIQCLDSIKVMCPEAVLDRFRDCYEMACANDVDILVYPEMLGVEALYELDDYGFNPEIKRLGRVPDHINVPELIVAPSYWNNCSNCVSVYLSSGKELCRQYKQHRYHHGGSDGKAGENLKNIPSEICVIHIPDWGRIVIPICIDFLFEDYRGLLVKALKANLVLCVSYTASLYYFLKAMESHSEFGVVTVWVNSCSAKCEASSEVPELVGAVSCPSVTSGSSVIRLIPECGGDCKSGCLFVIKIPLNRMGDSPYEEKVASFEHKVAGS